MGANQTKVHDELLEAFTQLNRVLNALNDVLDSDQKQFLISELSRDGIDNVFSREARDERYRLIDLSIDTILAARERS